MDKVLKVSKDLVKRSKFFAVQDGNSATAHVAYALSENAFIYPITPSTTMPELVDTWIAQEKKNVYGMPMKCVEMESEQGASGSIHGSLLSGGLTTTFTASQGLLLMIPNMYKIGGELLPAVFHVASRAVGTHSLSIFADHSDVMATKQTGFAYLCSANPQECHDLAIVAHLAAVKASTPFLHFFDGFRTSHELNKIEMLDYDEIETLVDYQAIKDFKKRALNPENPDLKGIVTGPDVFMQMGERHTEIYNKVPQIVKECMKKVGDLTGRHYKLFDYFGAEDAEKVIVIMGSGANTAKETCEFLNKKEGTKYGVIAVRMFRPWSAEDFMEAIPKTCKDIAVLDHYKDFGYGEELYLEVKASIHDFNPDIRVFGGRYALGMKEFTPSMVKEVFKNLALENPKKRFTVGIIDDVTHLSLPLAKEEINVIPDDIKQSVFWGIGGDGTVGANQQAIAIIGDNTDLKGAQGFFDFDAKKSGGLTVSHLRFGKEEINSSYKIQYSDYTAIHAFSYIKKFGKTLVKGAKDNSSFVVCCPWTDLKAVEEHFPGDLKQEIAKKNLKVYVVDGERIAEDVGLGKKVSMIMQAVFFKLSQVLPIEESMELLKEAIREEFKLKGDIVEMNIKAMEEAIESIVEIKYDADTWKNSEIVPREKREIAPEVKDFVESFVDKITYLEGDDMKVSDFIPGGQVPVGTSRYEKRGVSSKVPKWDASKCIQCGICAFVCPHTVVRPFLFTDEELEYAPEGFDVLDSNDKNIPYKFRIQISVLDCVGCQNCVEECPVDALSMSPLEQELEDEQDKNWLFAFNTDHKAKYLPEIDKFTVKGCSIQFPYLEFPGSCAGCGESPYIKILTQLYGDRIVLANAAGCSSVWGSYAPTAPYCPDETGRGPAWASSLFEDNAEFGLGMHVAAENNRAMLAMHADKVINSTNCGVSKELVDNLKLWIENKDDAEMSRVYSDAIKEVLPEDAECDSLQHIIDNKNLLSKQSQWIMGGDGWAYDIGIGGVIHTLASGENVKLIVMDTNVYSNTGGQASKATPLGAKAKFQAAGKETPKMDLGAIAMSLGTCYVASCSLGADKKQYLKAIKEAEEFDGPALVLCYAPCIGHGVKGDMKYTQEEERLVVKSGFWPLYRFDPFAEKPFTYDFKKIKPELMDQLLDSELRFYSLQRMFPERADRLHDALKAQLIKQNQKYLALEANQ